MPKSTPMPAEPVVGVGEFALPGSPSRWPPRGSLAPGPRSRWPGVREFGLPAHQSRWPPRGKSPVAGSAGWSCQCHPQAPLDLPLADAALEQRQDADAQMRFQDDHSLPLPGLVGEERTSRRPAPGIRRPYVCSGCGSLTRPQVREFGWPPGITCLTASALYSSVYRLWLMTPPVGS